MAFPTIVEEEETLTSWRAARPTNRGSRCKSRHAVARCRQAYATAQTAEAQAVVDAPIPVPAFTLAVMDRLTGAGNFTAAGCSRQPPHQRMQPTSATGLSSVNRHLPLAGGGT
jgi:hypothetical protein